MATKYTKISIYTMIFLSAIIPTQNRAKKLNRVLISLAKQTMSQNEFEVIVVDNGSSDNTKEVVHSLNNEIKNLRYFYEKIPGLHMGRHKGLREATADVLVYADDDIEAFPTWLEGIKESFEETDAVLVGGKILPKFEIEPPEWILKMWLHKKRENMLIHLSILDLGNKIKKINPYYVFGCNFSIRKSVLLKAGGFHPDSMPEELVRYRGDGETHVSRFIAQNRLKALYNPKASVFHVIPKERMTIEYFCQRAFNQGISDSYAELRNGYFYSYSKTCYRIIKRIKHKLIRILRYSLIQKKDKINKLLLDFHYRGYDYHQNEVKKDPRLKEWILRDNYSMMPDFCESEYITKPIH